jgi:polyisoprenoid-binding protein YceI
MRAMLLALLTLPGSARAADYVAAPGATLGFSVEFQGETVEGKFARFTPAIRFDPAHPVAARFDVGIDLASVSTGVDDGDTLLRGPDFFAVARTPQARFQARKARSLGGGRYAIDGQLSLRGVSRPVTLAFTRTAGARPVLAGEAQLKRRDFGLGGGEFGSEIGEQVKVTTRVPLLPAPAAKAPVAAPKPALKPAPKPIPQPAKP